MFVWKKTLQNSLSLCKNSLHSAKLTPLRKTHPFAITSKKMLFCKTLKQAEDLVVFHKNPNNKIWARDLPGKGPKEYIVATIPEFVEFYNKQEARHFHEVICRGQPCNLYMDFDWEYAKHDEKKTFDILRFEKASFVESVIEHLCATIEGLAEDEIEVIELDSSAVHKFSRHVILRMHGRLFRNSHHCLAFLQRIPDQPKCWDTTVYTDSHCLRLEGSSKPEEPKRVLVFIDSKFKFEDCLVQPLIDAKLMDFKIEKPSENKVENFPNPELLKRIILAVQSEKWPAIYARKYSAESHKLLLCSKKAKFCLQLGREHHNNHVFFRVCLSDNPPFFYQSCPSPYCVIYDESGQPHQRKSQIMLFDSVLEQEIVAEFTPETENDISEGLHDFCSKRKQLD
jgi:hypothetical protein